MERKEKLYSFYKSQYDDINIEDNRIIKSYTSVSSEYNLLKHGVGVRDLSNYSKAFIHGKDSESLLKRLTTNDIGSLKVLEWKKTLFTNFDGNIIDKSLLLKFEDYFILIGSNTEEGKLFKWIKRFIVKDDIVLSNSDDDYCLFEIMGSQATSYMSMILGEKFDQLTDNNILRVQIDDYFVHGIRVQDYATTEKYIVIVDSIHAVKTLEIMEDRKSVFDFGMVGEDAYNIFRIENGIPIAPNELNDSVNPSEVYLNSEISKHKNSFIGHTNIKSGNSELSRLIKIQFQNDKPRSELPFSIVNSNNEEVGIITSITDGLEIKEAVGLGFIDIELKLNGTSYYAVDGNNKFKLNISEIRDIRNQHY